MSPTYSVDLHAHTRFFHAAPGRPTFFDPVGAALLGQFGRARSLDGIAFTNHDYYRPYESRSSLDVVPGIEISTTGGHVLVVGPDPPHEVEPGVLTPQEAVAIAHERDCAAILPHPFRRGTLWKSGAPFDAVEVNGKRPQIADRVSALAEELDVPVVGGSDAHFPFEVGRVHTLVDADVLTARSVVDAIRDGRVRPKVAEGDVHRVLRRGYSFVHEYKGHREDTAVSVFAGDVPEELERHDESDVDRRR